MQIITSFISSLFSLFSVCLQSDGKVMACISFTLLSLFKKSDEKRDHQLLDITFFPFSLCLQSDGKVMICVMNMIAK